MICSAPMTIDDESKNILQYTSGMFFTILQLIETLSWQTPFIVISFDAILFQHIARIQEIELGCKSGINEAQNRLGNLWNKNWKCN